MRLFSDPAQRAEQITIFNAPAPVRRGNYQFEIERLDRIRYLTRTITTLRETRRQADWI